MARRWMLVAMAVTMAGSWCTAADSNAAQSPKATAQAFAKALAAGDAATAKSLTTGNPDDGEILDALTGMIGAMKRLNQAAIAKFGPEAARLLVPRDPGEEMTKHFDEAQETIEGETATLTTKNEKTPLALKRTAGQWKVDISSMPDRSELVQALPLFRAMAGAADVVSAEIGEGKYKSADKAQKAFGVRMNEIMTRPTASTQPASRPATRP